MPLTVAFHNSGASANMKRKNKLAILVHKSTTVLPIPLLRKAVGRWQQAAESTLQLKKEAKKITCISLLDYRHVPERQIQ